jgi:hypothetical protein
VGAGTFVDDGPRITGRAQLIGFDAMSDLPLNHSDDLELRAEARASLGSDERAADLPAMTREQAILRLADRLPENAFASIHLSEVALATRDAAADLRAGKAARFSREWSVLITAPGYQHNHAGDELGPVVEQALADYLDWRQEADAREWARSAVPDSATTDSALPNAATPDTRPPKLLAPGTADAAAAAAAERQRGREKDAG